MPSQQLNFFHKENISIFANISFIIYNISIKYINICQYINYSMIPSRKVNLKIFGGNYRFSSLFLI